METPEVVALLNDLIKLDVDAMHAYSQAMKEMDIASVQARLTTFRQDHERHARDLAQLVRTIGGTPTQPTKDFKGYLMEGFTAIGAKMGMTGALKSMLANEHLTNRRYEQARNQPLPADIKAVLERNLEDERHHLEYIQTAIREHT